MKKKSLFLLICLLVCIICTVSVYADEAQSDHTDQVPDEYANLLESLPEEIIDLLPPSLFSSDAADVTDGTSEMSNFSYLLNAILSLVGLQLGDCAFLLYAMLSKHPFGRIVSGVRFPFYPRSSSPSRFSHRATARSKR